MQELMSVGTQLTRESSRGGAVLQALDDAFARVMRPKRRGHVRGVGFELTPFGRKARNVLSYSLT